MNPEQTLISEAVADWIVYCSKFTRKNQSRYRLVIIRFVGSLPDNETINQLSYEHIENYLKSVIGKYSPKTIEKYRICLRTFYHWISRQYGIKNVVPDVRLRLKKPPILKSGEINTITEWLNYNKRHSPNTQEIYLKVIIGFCEFLPEDIKSIDKLHSRHIENYLSSLLGSGLKNSSINAHRVALKSFCKWLSRNFDVPNFTKGIQRLREEPFEARVLTQDEYQKVLAVCSERNRDVIRFLANSGLRVSELLNIKWRDIGAEMLTVSNGKGRKLRHIPLNSICQEILQKYERGPDDSRVDFISYWKNRKSIYNICTNLAEQAGIPVAGPHSYRHFFAVSLMKKGVSLGHIQRLLGHASIQTTEIYLRLSDDDLKGCTEVLTEGGMIE